MIKKKLKNYRRIYYRDQFLSAESYEITKQVVGTVRTFCSVSGRKTIILRALE